MRMKHILIPCVSHHLNWCWKVVLQTSLAVVTSPCLSLLLALVKVLSSIYVQNCKVSCDNVPLTELGLNILIQGSSRWGWSPQACEFSGLLRKSEAFAVQTYSSYFRDFIAVSNLHSLLILQVGINSVSWKCRRNYWLERYQLRGGTATAFQRPDFEFQRDWHAPLPSSRAFAYQAVMNGTSYHSTMYITLILGSETKLI